MEWLNSVFGETNAGIATLSLAILAALFVLWIIYRLFRSSGGHFSGSRNTRAHRLEVVDATAVDNRRRLVLVRCDNREHLVLIGGMNDLVIDKDVGRRDPESDRVPDIIAVDEPAPATRQKPEPAPRREDRPAPPPAPAPRPEPVVVAAPEPEPTPDIESNPAISSPAPQEGRRSTDRAWTKPLEAPVSGRRMTDVANLAAPAVAAVAVTPVTNAGSSERQSPANDRMPAPVERDEPAFEGLVAERDVREDRAPAPAVTPVRPAPVQADDSAMPTQISEPSLEEEIEAEMDRLISDLRRD